MKNVWEIDLSDAKIALHCDNCDKTIDKPNHPNSKVVEARMKGKDGYMANHAFCSKSCASQYMVADDENDSDDDDMAQGKLAK